MNKPAETVSVRVCETCPAELEDHEHAQCWDCYYEEIERTTDEDVAARQHRKAPNGR